MECLQCCFLWQSDSVQQVDSEDTYRASGCKEGTDSVWGQFSIAGLAIQEPAGLI